MAGQRHPRPKRVLAAERRPAGFSVDPFAPLETLVSRLWRRATFLKTYAGYLRGEYLSVCADGREKRADINALNRENTIRDRADHHKYHMGWLLRALIPTCSTLRKPTTGALDACSGIWGKRVSRPRTRGLQSDLCIPCKCTQKWALLWFPLTTFLTKDYMRPFYSPDRISSGDLKC